MDERDLLGRDDDGQKRELGRKFRLVADEYEGDDFLNTKQIQKLLGVSERTIWKYFARSYLRPLSQGRRIGASKKDVDLLIQAEAADLPVPLNGITLVRILAEQRQLRQEVDFLLAAFDLRNRPLKLNDTEALAFYRMAEQYGESGWPPHIELELAGYFQRLRYEDLEQLARLTDDKHPWKVLYRFILSLEMKSYDQRLKPRFGAGRANLERQAVIWVTLRDGSTPNIVEYMITDEALPMKKLLRELSRQQKTNESPY